MWWKKMDLFSASFEAFLRLPCSCTFLSHVCQTESDTPMILHFSKSCMSDITNKPIARDTMHPKSAKRSRFCHKWVKNVFVFVCLFVFCTGVRFKVHLLRTPTPPSKTLGLGYRPDYKSQNFEPKEWEKHWTLWETK